jgi:Helix-turn-helix
MITPAQVRAAMAIFDMTKKQLGAQIRVTGQTISAFVHGKNISGGTLKKIEDYYRARGLLFLEPGDTRGNGPGVRFIREEERPKA